MSQERPSTLGSNNVHWLRTAIDEWGAALVIVLVGLSQVVLSLSLFVSGGERIGFVLGSGGWLLVGIGTNLLRDRDPFRLVSTESTLGMLYSLVLLLLTGIVVYAAVTVTVGLG